VLLESAEDAEVTVVARFLHLQRRTAEAPDGSGGFRAVASVPVAGSEVTTWDEAAEREHSVSVSITALLAGGVDATFEVPGSESTELLTDASGQAAGRLVRRSEPLAGLIHLGAQRLPGPFGGLRLRVRVENHTSADRPLLRRQDGLPLALIATHALIHVRQDNGDDDRVHRRLPGRREGRALWPGPGPQVAGSDQDVAGTPAAGGGGDRRRRIGPAAGVPPRAGQHHQRDPQDAIP
jgi:hypothetical protein